MALKARLSYQLVRPSFYTPRAVPNELPSIFSYPSGNKSRNLRSSRDADTGFVELGNRPLRVKLLISKR